MKAYEDKSKIERGVIRLLRLGLSRRNDIRVLNGRKIAEYLKKAHNLTGKELKDVAEPGN